MKKRKSVAELHEILRGRHLYTISYFDPETLEPTLPLRVFASDSPDGVRLQMIVFDTDEASLKAFKAECSGEATDQPLLVHEINLEKAIVSLNSLRHLRPGFVDGAYINNYLLPMSPAMATTAGIGPSEALRTILAKVFNLKFSMLDWATLWRRLETETVEFCTKAGLLDPPSGKG